MKHWFKFLLVLALVISGLSFSTTSYAAGDKEEESINEKFGLPIVVLGGTLNDDQKQEVREMLKVTILTWLRKLPLQEKIL